MGKVPVHGTSSPVPSTGVLWYFKSSTKYRNGRVLQVQYRNTKKVLQVPSSTLLFSRHFSQQFATSADGTQGWQLPVATAKIKYPLLAEKDSSFNVIKKYTVK